VSVCLFVHVSVSVCVQQGGGRYKAHCHFSECSEFPEFWNRPFLPGVSLLDMKRHSWPGALCGLALLAFLCHCATAVERRYYIAAVNINWDYTSAGQQRYEK